ncbi:hypothetical protein BN133_833 [Cronobacter dublinensis 582]|nr:hypothetical protein BN133_833 [Cronobacter dublinensis 582]
MYEAIYVVAVPPAITYYAARHPLRACLRRPQSQRQNR